MIPRDNIKNLVLNEEVVKAVEDGKFHIYAVSSIDEGIEVLTGTPAGEIQEDDTYPEGTVHYLVEKRLEALARSAREFSRSLDGRGADDQSNGSG
jgi:predicted ATP-dependent protease